MSVLGAALSVGRGFMTYAQGRQQANALSGQASQEEANARIAERNRETAATEAANEQVKAMQRRNITSGQNAAALGSGGLESGSGLGAALERANNNAYTNDAQQINRNLASRDLDLRQEIANRQQAASSYRSAAKTTKRAALLNGVLTTAAGLYGGGKAASSAKSSTTKAPAYRWGSSGYGLGGNSNITLGGKWGNKTVFDSKNGWR